MRSIIDLFFRRNDNPETKTKAPIVVSTGAELEDDFSMELSDDLLSGWRAYCLSGRKINSIESLNHVLSLLEQINEQKNTNYYSLRLQKTIVDAFDWYKETNIIMPYQSIVCVLDKEEFMSHAELKYLDMLCQEGLMDCKKFMQLSNIIIDRFKDFSNDHQRDLESIFITAHIFSEKGKDNVQPKVGFYFCKNKIKEKQIEKDIQKICDDVTILCDHVKDELKDSSYNYQSLRFSRERLQTEEKKLAQLSGKFAKNSGIDRFIKTMNDTKNKIETAMTVSRLFANNNLELIRDKATLKAITTTLENKPSYLALMEYGERSASSEKKLIFPRFIERFKNANNLDELYTLIVEGHSSKSIDPEILSLNSDMIRNTRCGICGLFGLFYKSTTHLYLTQVAKDFKKIVDDYFENNSKVNKVFSLTRK
jgi:hypothetical protein